VPAWTVLHPTAVRSAGGATLTTKRDGSVLASGKNPHPEVYTVRARTALTGITGFRLEVLPDPSLPSHGPGRAPNGNFVLNEFRVSAAPSSDPAKATPVVLHRAVADYSQPEWAVAGAIDGNPQTGWAIDPAFGKAHVAVFEAKEPLRTAGGTTLTFVLDQQFAGRDHTIGRLRLSVTTGKPPLGIDALPDRIAHVLAVPAEKRTAAQKEELARYFRSQDAELASLSQALAEFPLPGDRRLLGAQDLAWALLNSPEFLFNH
jgi:hypothetical protein